MVLVSVDYRQGPFGFLSLNTSEVSGNQGLRDQQLALRWVSENIGQFGGNPDKVLHYGTKIHFVDYIILPTYNLDDDVFFNNSYSTTVEHSNFAKCQKKTTKQKKLCSIFLPFMKPYKKLVNLLVF